MRVLGFSLVLLGAASSSAAQEAAPRQLAPEDAARLLANPAAQDLIAQQIARLAGIILDTKVGALAPLADPRDGVRPDDTLHSIEQRRDPDLDRHLYERSHKVVASAGGIAGGAVAEAAELRRTTDSLRAALTPVVEAAGALRPEQ